MRRLLKTFALTLTALALAAGIWLAWTVSRTLPERDGSVAISGLKAPVTVRYDERGVPHIRADNEIDLYRALGYVHAQDRLFQMELMRRLANGELAEILGPALLDTDRLFRTLGLRQHAQQRAAQMDRSQASSLALAAYLDGINQFQESDRLPIEFKLLGIEPRDFSAQDVWAVSGYLAYSFAAAFRTEPVLTHIRDQLGPSYLRIFQAEGLPTQNATLEPAIAQSLAQVASLSLQAIEEARLPLQHGSNAWALSGSRTASGKPLLAGDPHISFALPSVWYEAHLQAPGFELYGYHQALSPFALIGHNQAFAWSLTMFQNDDIDFVAEKTDPSRPDQVWHQGRWVPLQVTQELIAVKGQAPMPITLRRSPHGPLITDVFRPVLSQQAVALWWTFLESDNPLLNAFHSLNRADTLGKAREAVSKIHAPGLNVVWAHAGGDIAWWAAARLPLRPAGIDPRFVLDASRGEAVKLGYAPFAQNPQEENPARGYIVSANHQPGGLNPPAGYYNLPERARRIDAALRDPQRKWTVPESQQLQQDVTTSYASRLLKTLLAALQGRSQSAEDEALLRSLAQWDGAHSPDSVQATVFTQWLYETARAALLDELGPVHFDHLLKTRALDHALPQLLADPTSPWWDQKGTEQVQTHQDIVHQAWQASLQHLRATLGADPGSWTWAKAHTVTHGHPLGRKKPLNLLFDVGPYGVPGGRELPNNFAHPLGPAPWKVTYGPSTRRVIDLSQPGQAVGGNPTGQSGVLFDRHYKDQAEGFHQGRYMPQHLLEASVQAHTRSTLTLRPEK